MARRSFASGGGSGPNTERKAAGRRSRRKRRRVKRVSGKLARRNKGTEGKGCHGLSKRKAGHMVVSVPVRRAHGSRVCQDCEQDRGRKRGAPAKARVRAKVQQDRKADAPASIRASG